MLWLREENVGRCGFVSIVERNLLLHQQKIGSSAQSVWSDSSAQSVWSGSSAQSVWSGSSAQSAWGGSSAQSVWSGSSAQSVWSGSSAQSVWSGSSAQSAWSGSMPEACGRPNGLDSYMQHNVMASLGQGRLGLVSAFNVFVLANTISEMAQGLSKGIML